jgi:hypothetical protein
MKKQYIGILEYFATGEGVTYVIASGTVAEIKEFAGPYFSIGLAFYSFDEVRSALSECKHLDENSFIDDKCVRDAYLLQTHLPTTAQFIQQYGFGTFSYKFHYNLS